MVTETVRGPHASSLLYILVITAKINSVNLYTAFVKLFTELPTARSLEDFKRLADLILAPQPPCLAKMSDAALTSKEWGGYHRIEDVAIS